jgi:putative hef-like homing endonuclease
MECKICGYSSDPANMSKHLRKIHSLEVQEYYDKYVAEEGDGSCKICGKPTKFLGLSRGYRECCCGACTMELHYGVRNAYQLENTKETIKNTMLERYGVENAFQSEEIREKIKQTNLDRYGAENVFASEYGKNKIKETNLDRYGVEYNMQSEEVKSKVRDTLEKNYGGIGWASKSIKEKAEKTNLDKYGSENVFGSEYGKQKVKETNLRKRGVEHVFQDPEVQEKIKQTNLDKFGAENPFASEQIKEKIKETNLKRHGGTGLASPSIKEKTRKTFQRKYGSNSPFGSKEVQEKIKQTNLDRYGVEYTLGSKELRDKFESNFCAENDVTSILSLGIRYHKKISKKYYDSILKFRNKNFIKNDLIQEVIEYDKELQSKAKVYNSRFEKEIHEWLQSIYSGEIQVNTRRIISPLELDFYLPEKNLALEFNGDYWHSSAAGIDNDYHLSKTLACTENGIRLIHIFEYEWRLKKDIIKSIISSALGIYKNKVYARQCEIREVSSKEAKEFLENNHLQGFVPSSYRIGLYFDNELVQLLCFGENRFKKNEVELLRMCAKLNTQIIGGFSKLLKHSKIEEFISYVDLSKYTARGYLSNGFVEISRSAPNYKYIYGDTILSRIATQKHKLPDLLGDKFDASKTESQNMINNDYWQVFDCGNLKLSYSKLSN